MLGSVFGQHLFNDALVVRVGELGVAAQRVGFDDPLRIVGVIAVGGTAGRNGDVAHSPGSTGLEHIRSSFYVDRIQKLPRVV